jgi:hypothetical protein
MTLITCYQINNTYAKYLTEVETSAQENIGAWIIKVNDINIASNTEIQTFNIDKLIYNSNEYVIDGKIAPGLTGYFDIKIDATESSVAVIYNISINFEKLNLIDAIKFTKLVQIIDGEESASGVTQTDVNTYTGIISLEEIEEKKITTVRVYVEWENSQNENDDEDTILGAITNLNLQLPVEVKASQYLGEEIVEYTT